MSHQLYLPIDPRRLDKLCSQFQRFALPKNNLFYHDYQQFLNVWTNLSHASHAEKQRVASYLMLPREMPLESLNVVAFFQHVALSVAHDQTTYTSVKVSEIEYAEDNRGHGHDPDSDIHFIYGRLHQDRVLSQVLRLVGFDKSADCFDAYTLGSNLAGDNLERVIREDEFSQRGANLAIQLMEYTHHIPELEVQNINRKILSGATWNEPHLITKWAGHLQNLPGTPENTDTKYVLFHHYNTPRWRAYLEKTTPQSLMYPYMVSTPAKNVAPSPQALGDPENDPFNDQFFQQQQEENQIFESILGEAQQRLDATQTVNEQLKADLEAEKQRRQDAENKLKLLVSKKLDTSKQDGNTVTYPDEIKKLNAQLFQKDQQLQECKHQLNEKVQTITTIQEALSQKIQEYKNLLKDKQGMKELIESLTKKSDSFDIAEELSKLKVLRLQFSKLQEEKEQLQQRSLTLEQTVTSLQQEKKEKYAKLEEINTLKQENSNLRTRVTALEQMREKAENPLLHNQDQKDLKQNISELEQQKDILSRKIEDMFDIIKANEEITKLKHDVGTLFGEKTELEKLLNSKGKSQDPETNITSLIHQKATLEQRVKVLKKSLDDKETLCEQALEELQSFRENESEEIQKLQNEVERLTTALGSQLSDNQIAQNYQKQLENLRNEKDELAQKLKNSDEMNILVDTVLVGHDLQARRSIITACPYFLQIFHFLMEMVPKNSRPDDTTDRLKLLIANVGELHESFKTWDNVFRAQERLVTYHRVLEGFANSKEFGASVSKNCEIIQKRFNNLIELEKELDNAFTENGKVCKSRFFQSLVEMLPKPQEKKSGGLLSSLNPWSTSKSDPSPQLLAAAAALKKCQDEKKLLAQQSNQHASTGPNQQQYEAEIQALQQQLQQREIQSQTLQEQLQHSESQKQTLKNQHDASVQQLQQHVTRVQNLQQQLQQLKQQASLNQAHQQQQQQQPHLAFATEEDMKKLTNDVFQEVFSDSN